MGILQRISRAITRLNKRLAAGSRGRAGLRDAEREQFEANDDKRDE